MTTAVFCTAFLFALGISIWYIKIRYTYCFVVLRVGVRLKICNKLVRDNIPDICLKNGQMPNTFILDDEAYRRELRKKLVEEVNEYLESGETEELADITEVIDALSVLSGASFEKVLEIKNKKAETNGRFEKRIFLETVE